MKKLLIRTASGTVYVLLMLLAIYGGRLFGTKPLGELYGTIIFCAIFFAIAMIGVYETVHNLKKRGKSLNGPLTVIISAVTYMAASTLNMGHGFGPLILVVLLMPAVALLAQLWRHEENPMASVGYTLLPLYWVVMPLVLLGYLHILSASMVMMLFILIWVNDSFAYLSGWLLGRHKMWERHSPGKTWEGTAGGFLFCVATALTVGPLFDTPVDTLWGWAVVGILCSVLGTLGDLVESMFKRSCGVKDSGNIMPGHGGVLDRFDSILMTTPFVLVFVMVFFNN